MDVHQHANLRMDGHVQASLQYAQPNVGTQSEQGQKNVMERVGVLQTAKRMKSQLRFKQITPSRFSLRAQLQFKE